MSKQKALLLLSGGIDSPVAGYLMQKKGLEIIAIHFSSEPFTDNTPENKSIEAAKKIGIKQLFTIKIGNQLSELTKKCTHKFYYVLQRRLMWRIAEIIAKKEDCKFLVTGENLAQVSSQTLSNIKATDNSVKLAILRPILTFDKQETVDLAKKIGTYEISKGPEFCCVLGPKSPATKTTIKTIEKEEEKIDLKDMIKEAIKSIKSNKL